MRALSTLVSLGALFALGCDPPAPTYLNATKAIVDAKCAGCHSEGGIAPFPLTTHAEIALVSDLVRGAVESGVMPPWLAAKDCNSYSNDFSLSDADKATLLAWIDDGAPEGEPTGTTSQALSDPFEVAIRYDEVFEAAPEAYLPDSNDDYRCFAIAWPHEADKYITGFDMIPGDPANVHHVNVFLNPPPAEADGVDFVQYDLEDPLPGFSFGRGDRVLSSALIGAWAPGASGVAYPEGTGQLVVPGSSITLEVHYAVQSGIPDDSQLALELADAVERRGIGTPFWWFNNWENGGMPIPAGEASVTHEMTVDPSFELAVLAPWITSRNIEIHVAALHMHQLGSSGQIIVRSPIGDSCLVDIPAWDYHWQNAYELEEPVELFLGEDELFLSCTWDNSAANQPYVDGVQQEPRDVNWGVKVSDEMCIGFLYMVPIQ